ncbi:MAG: glycosyl hydrolase family 32, partial [Microbacterium sp.]
TWAVPAASELGPFDLDAAYPLTDEHLYVGRLLRRRDDGQWLLFAFWNADASGNFIGGITDPMPVGWQGDRLVVLDPPSVPGG